MQVFGCLFVSWWGHFLIVLLGDVLVDSDWRTTTFGENQQQCIKIGHSLTMLAQDYKKMIYTTAMS